MTASGSRTWPGLRVGTNRRLPRSSAGWPRLAFCRLVVLAGRDGADEADELPPADRTVGSTNLAAPVERVTESGKRLLEGFNDMAITHSTTGSAAE